MANENFIDSDSMGLQDVSDETREQLFVSPVINFIKEKFTKAEDTRRMDEERWVKAYRNYRGIYGPDVQFTEAEKSRVFIKVTKTKTLAAYGQIIDVLFANNNFPLSVEPTVLPEGVVADVHIDMKNPGPRKKARTTKSLHTATGAMAENCLRGLQQRHCLTGLALCVTN